MPVGDDVIGPAGRAHHPIAAAAIGGGDLLGSRSREHGRGAAAVDDPVVAGLAVDAVVARAVVDLVVARPLVEPVVAAGAVDEVIAKAAIEPVVAALTIFTWG